MTTRITVQKEILDSKNLLPFNVLLELIAFTISVFHFLSVASPFLAITSECVLIWDVITQMECQQEQTQILQFISKTKDVREGGGILIWKVTSALVSNPQKWSIQYCSCKFEHGQKAKNKKRSVFLQLFPKKVIKRVPSLPLNALREYKENQSVKGCCRECRSIYKFEASFGKQRQQVESWELRFCYFYIRTHSKYIMHIGLLVFGYVQVQNQSNVWYSVSWDHFPTWGLEDLLFFWLLSTISFTSILRQPCCILVFHTLSRENYKEIIKDNICMNLLLLHTGRQFWKSHIGVPFSLIIVSLCLSFS